MKKERLWKRIAAAIVAGCLVLLCTGCTMEECGVVEGEWECIYTSIDNEIYQDDLNYKMKVFVKNTQYAILGNTMQVCVEIYNAFDVYTPIATYYSDELSGNIGVNVKHTMANDTTIDNFYESFAVIIYQEYCIAALRDVHEKNLEDFINTRVYELSSFGKESFLSISNRYSEEVLASVQEAAIESLFSAGADAVTSPSEAINLFTTSTVGFLEDLGVYVDETDVDLTMMIKDCTMQILEYLFDINQAALVAVPGSDRIPTYENACKESREAFMQKVLAACGQA